MIRPVNTTNMKKLYIKVDALDLAIPLFLFYFRDSVTKD